MSCDFRGEFVLVNVLVLWDMLVGAVLPGAARGPPEEALLFERATVGEKFITWGSTSVKL